VTSFARSAEKPMRLLAACRTPGGVMSCGPLAAGDTEPSSKRSRHTSGGLTCGEAIAPAGRGGTKFACLYRVPRSRLRKFTQRQPQGRAAQQCLSRYWLSKLTLRRTFLALDLGTQFAGRRQPIQPVEQSADRSDHPQPVPSCCRNTASGESRRDSIRRSYAARPYLGNDRCERGRACISPGDRYPAGSLASLLGRDSVDRHYITVTSTRNPSPTAGPVQRKRTILSDWRNGIRLQWTSGPAGPVDRLYP
jgi:hypothetical protein